MKRIALVPALFVSLFLLGAVTLPAQDKSKAQKYEYAMIKWDGPDRIQYILPGKFEIVRLGKTFPRPEGAQEKEYYLAMATNELAKQGWEAVSLDSRRILLRRPVSK